MGKVHHSDQKNQYVTDEYVKLLQHYAAKIRMTEIGQTDPNGAAEHEFSAEKLSVLNTIKGADVDVLEYQNFVEVYQQIEQLLHDVYLKKYLGSDAGDCFIQSENLY